MPSGKGRRLSVANQTRIRNISMRQLCTRHHVWTGMGVTTHGSGYGYGGGGVKQYSIQQDGSIKVTNSSKPSTATGMTEMYYRSQLRSLTLIH